MFWTAPRGQSLVEAAIAMPVVLLLALGVTDLGRAFYYREAAANSARQALRMAVSPYQHGTADAICANTTGGPVPVTVTSPIPPSGGAIVTVANQAALESSRDGTPGGSVLAGATISVTFHCLNSAAITNATGNGGGPANAGSDSISVSITLPMRVVTPVLWPLTGPSYPIKASASERVEY